MKYKMNLGFITQKIQGKTTIFAGEKSVLFTLNETGSLIFQGLKLGWSEEKIIEKITSKYSISKKSAEDDFLSFTHLLLKKGIISPNGA